MPRPLQTSDEHRLGAGGPGPEVWDVITLVWTDRAARPLSVPHAYLTQSDTAFIVRAVDGSARITAPKDSVLYVEQSDTPVLMTPPLTENP